jgi:hypothetical protein
LRLTVRAFTLALEASTIPVGKESAMTRLTMVLALTAVPLIMTPAQAQTPRMSFFVTSAGPGAGANLGGLEGADRHCATLADAVGAGGQNWRAYLSTTAADGKPAVNARDRIGRGPWYNAKGQLIAENLDDLHSENPKWTKQTALNEKGEVVNGRGDTPNRHDILTGSRADGTVLTGDADTTCRNWTSDGEGSAQLGHHDRVGAGGAAPTSWNSSHASRGCSAQNLRATGGDGLFYCFVAN